MDMNEKNANWMDQLPPKVLFYGGLGGGVMALCTIGFFVLLGMVLGGKVGTGSALANNNAAPIDNVGANPAPQPDPAVKKPSDVTAADHVLGNKNAKVTLIEYSDFQCPFCSRFAPVAEKLVSESGGKVRLVYRHFPLDSIHPMAHKAAVAAECVANLRGNEVFWKYHTEIFNNQSGLSDTMLVDSAVKLGVNRAQMQSCLTTLKYANVVKAQQAEGESIGVQGTPATFVIAADGSFELIPGALDLASAKVYVDRALAK